MQAEELGTLQDRTDRLRRRLRKLHETAGRPSSRALAEKAGFSHSTLNEALRLRGNRLPTWPVVAALVTALEGDLEQFRSLWTSAHEALEPRKPSEAIQGGSEMSVFASYARVDDAATYGRISKFVGDLANAYQSLTGDSVAIFQDTESISLGDNWRDRIRLGLSSSSIFLAFISPAYLRSVHCREEFAEFLNFLKASNETRLIIPLLFAQETRLDQQFASDNLWTEISKLQCRPLYELRSAEPGSSAWLRAVEAVSNRIGDILSEAAQSSPRETESSDSASGLAASSGNETKGFLDRFAELEEVAPMLGEDLTLFAALIESVGAEVAAATPNLQKATTFGQKLAVTTHLANALTPLAEEMEEVASKASEGIGSWNVGVRQTIELIIADRIDPTEVGVTAFLQGVDDLARTGLESLSNLEEFLDSVVSVKGMSAKLDRPLNTLQRALEKFVELRATFRSWREELETLGSVNAQRSDSTHRR